MKFNQVVHLPYVVFRVASLAMGQSYDCPSTSGVTLKDMGKIHSPSHIKIKWSTNCVHMFRVAFFKNNSTPKLLTYDNAMVHLLHRCILPLRYTKHFVSNMSHHHTGLAHMGHIHLPLWSTTGTNSTWFLSWQAEPWWRASIWRSHRKVVIKQCSYHNNIIDIQNRLPYSKVVYPAIIVLFSCLMEVNHGVRTGPNYPFR